MKNKRVDPNKVQDTSPSIPQRNKIKNLVSINTRNLNDKQKEFLEIALDKSTKIIFISGPAGTSKTYMSVYAALHLLNDRRVSDLVYIRSAVESSDNHLGFLPGAMDDKMYPYLQPLLDKLTELLPKNDIDVLMKEKRITAIPVGFLRGLHWNAKAIIADESQNLSYKELFTLITRIGEFNKVFILGDPDQSDINGKSGFTKMMNVFDNDESKNNGIRVFKFTENDIVRSELIKFIMKKAKPM